jgi:hypothetical protein
VVAGESSEAGNPGTLGMTKRGGSLQGKGGCWMKGQLLNREFFRSNLDNSSAVPAGLFNGAYQPRTASWAKFSRPYGTEMGNGVLTQSIKALIRVRIYGRRLPFVQSVSVC